MNDIFVLKLSYSEVCYLFTLIGQTNFNHLPIFLLHSSSVWLLFFLWQLMSKLWRETLILSKYCFSLNFPSYISIHWWFLPESNFIMMVVKWWFPNCIITSVLLAFYYKEELSPFWIQLLEIISWFTAMTEEKKYLHNSQVLHLLSPIFPIKWHYF